MYQRSEIPFDDTYEENCFFRTLPDYLAETEEDEFDPSDWDDFYRLNKEY